jgi:hypothetical protein
MRRSEHQAIAVRYGPFHRPGRCLTMAISGKAEDKHNERDPMGYRHQAANTSHRNSNKFF